MGALGDALMVCDHGLGTPDRSLIREASVSAMADGVRHPVVIRMTPWSIEVLRNACLELPAALQVISGCDCKRIVDEKLGEMHAFLMHVVGHRWSIRGVRRADDFMCGPGVWNEYVVEISRIAGRFSTHPLGLLPRMCRDRLARPAGNVPDASGDVNEDADDGTGTETLVVLDHEPRTGHLGWCGSESDRDFGVRACASREFESCLAEALDSGDPEIVWRTLVYLKTASGDRIQRLFEHGFLGTEQWSGVHRGIAAVLKLEASGTSESWLHRISRVLLLAQQGFARRSETSGPECSAPECSAPPPLS